MTAAAEATSRADRYIQRCLLSDLIESGTNPRKRRDPAADEELRNSILEVGVLEPILVRAIATGADAKFEIIAGSRRYRAAKDAGLEAIPAILKTLTDAEALEVQIVENLQRVDVHPLDEADGFAALIESQRYTIAAIALKVGKSESYVAQRLALKALEPAGRKLLDEDTITVSHALVIARLPKAAQGLALDWIKRNVGAYNSTVPTVNALEKWIGDQIHRNLSKAHWKKEDETLLPSVGSCNACQKRTDFHPELFPEVGAKSLCLDPPCFEKKVKAHLERKKKELKAEGESVREITRETHVPYVGGKQADILPSWAYMPLKKNDTCDFEEKGLVTYGGGVGDVVRICANKKCKVHCGADVGKAGRYDNDSESAKYRKKQAELERQTRELRAHRASLLRQVLSLADDLEDRDVLEVVTRTLVDRLWADHAKPAAIALNWDPKSDNAEHAQQFLRAQVNQPEMLRLVAIAVGLAGEVRTNAQFSGGSKAEPAVQLERLCKLLGIDTTQPKSEKASKGKKAAKGKASKGKPVPDLVAEQAKVDIEVAKIKASRAKPPKAKSEPVDDVEDGPCKCPSFDPSDDMDEGVCTCGHHEDEHDTAGALQACLAGHADDDETEVPATPSKAKGKAPKGQALKAGV